MPLVYIAALRPQHQAPVSELEGFDLFLSTIVDDRKDWGKKQTCLFGSGTYRYSPYFVETHLDASITMKSTGKARQVFLCEPFVQHRAGMAEVLAKIGAISDQFLAIFEPFSINFWPFSSNF